VLITPLISLLGRENVFFLGPPGTGKTHLAVGLGVRACQAGHRTAFATAAERVARLAEAHHAGRLQAELSKLGRVPLLIIDEVGYIRLVHWVPGTTGLQP
jgi:DNA replication protein DnaC